MENIAVTPSYGHGSRFATSVLDYARDYVQGGLCACCLFSAEALCAHI